MFQFFSSINFQNYDDLQAKKDSNFWNPSVRRLSLSLLDDDSDSGEHDECTKVKNNSTLSLHIAAYEDSTKADSEGSENADLNKKKQSLNKKWEIVKLFFLDSPSIIQNSFEFPRQQENEEVKIPEVSQFKASQTLLTPNNKINNTVVNQQQQQQIQSLENEAVAIDVVAGGNDKEKGQEEEEEIGAALNAQTYSSTNRILIALIFQIICVISASFPVIFAMYKFLRFQFISDGFWLEFGPIIAIGLALTFSLMASVWQFASVLSFRSIPSAMTHSKKGFFPALIIGLLLFVQNLLYSIILFSTNSNWEEPIRKNFDVLLEAAPNNAEAAEELNLLQLRFDCCGSTSKASSLPSRFASFQPFFETFHPHHLNSALHKTQNLPFSCCKRASPSMYCFHLNPLINPNSKFQTFPPMDFSREEAMATLNSGTDASCPAKIFEAIKWQLFNYPAISFLILGIICLCTTIFGGISLWNLRKAAAAESNQSIIKSVVKIDIQEMPKEEEVAIISLPSPAPVIVGNQVSTVTV
uniref:Uncharacterized protein n=1 Tax=Panagrolaimus sp. ES5 TaxID=591445 RepID=A0AC34F0L7_9BILA